MSFTKKDGAAVPTLGFPQEATQEADRPAVGGANPFITERGVPFLKELLLCTAGKITKSSVAFCERLSVAGSGGIGRRKSPSTTF